MASIVASPSVASGLFGGKMASDLGLGHSEDPDCFSPTIDLGSAFETIMKNCTSSTEREAQWRRNKTIKLKELTRKKSETNYHQEVNGENKSDDSKNDNIIIITEETNGVATVETTCIIGKENDISPIDDVIERSTVKDVSENAEQTQNIDSEQSSGLQTKIMEKDINKAPSTKPKDKKKPKKIQGKNKKWKPLVNDLVKFDTSILQFRNPHSDVTFEMESELEIFSMQCATNNDSIVSTSNSIDNDEVGPEENIPIDIRMRDIDGRNVFVYESITFINLSSQKVCELSPMVSDIEIMENKVPLKILEGLMMFNGSRNEKRLRVNEKWSVQKAHKQVKTKHCKHVGASNGGLGKNLYVSHRVSCRMEFQCSGKLRMQPSMKAIDRALGFSRDLKRQRQADSGRAVANPGVYVRPVIPVRDRGQPPPHRHVVNAYNADGDLESDLVNLLITMQDRDLTPEDYEMLLRLDERVAPKTVSEDVISKLKTEPVNSDLIGELCAVCMDEYSDGVLVKHLPCGHQFHAECIDNWLKNSSVSCPLDGTEIS